MKIVLLAGKETLYEQEYYSVGSGFIEWKGYKPPDKGKPKYPYATMKELMRHLGDNRISLPQLILANEMPISGKSEQQVWDFIDQVTNVMMGMVDTGLKSEGVLRHLYCSHGDDGERHEPEIQGDIGSWTRRPRTLLNGNFMKSRTRAAWVAWLLAAIYYFYDYALRSAPAVMMSQLSEAFDRSAAVVAGILGIFYYGYAALSLVAGTSTDRIGARTVVPAGNTLPSYLVGLIAGLASGSAMLLYTVIKEANPPQYSGTATGAINLLNFTFTAIMGQVFVAIMQAASQGKPTGLQHYQVAFQPLLYGVALALLLTFALKETGRAARVPEQTMVIA
jgi:hypothetical protein